MRTRRAFNLSKRPSQIGGRQFGQFAPASTVFSILRLTSNTGCTSCPPAFPWSCLEPFSTAWPAIVARPSCARWLCARRLYRMDPAEIEARLVVLTRQRRFCIRVELTSWIAWHLVQSLQNELTRPRAPRRDPKCRSCSHGKFLSVTFIARVQIQQRLTTLNAIPMLHGEFNAYGGINCLIGAHSSGPQFQCYSGQRLGIATGNPTVLLSADCVALGGTRQSPRVNHAARIAAVRLDHSNEPIEC